MTGQCSKTWSGKFHAWESTNFAHPPQGLNRITYSHQQWKMRKPSIQKMCVYLLQYKNNCQSLGMNADGVFQNVTWFKVLLFDAIADCQSLAHCLSNADNVIHAACQLHYRDECLGVVMLLSALPHPTEEHSLLRRNQQKQDGTVELGIECLQPISVKDNSKCVHALSSINITLDHARAPPSSPILLFLPLAKESEKWSCSTYTTPQPPQIPNQHVINIFSAMA